VSGGLEPESGLLYQRDPDSTNFPLTEIKRAIKCFRRRKDCAGLEPAVVYLNPGQAELVKLDQLGELGLTVELSERIAVNYIWLTGRDCEP
jgi:hypothetical protein